jgi:hypothetical protein
MSWLIDLILTGKMAAHVQKEIQKKDKTITISSICLQAASSRENELWCSYSYSISRIEPEQFNVLLILWGTISVTWKEGNNQDNYN